MMMIVSWISLCITVVQDSIYNKEYWHALSCAVKNRRATSEYLAAPAFATELEEIHSLHVVEMKEKKKLEKGQNSAANEPEENEDEEEEEPDDTAGMKHMMIGDLPTLPFKNPKAAKTDEAKKLSDKLVAFKKLAKRKVPCLEFHPHGLL